MKTLARKNANGGISVYDSEFATAPDQSPGLAGDLLNGVGPIANFLGLSERQT